MIIELMTLAAAGAATIFGYSSARRFVRDRLRFVDAVQKPTTPLLAGAAAAAVAVPLVALLPLVGAGTAILFGAGVGTGVAHGAKDAKGRVG